jgi:hypothetical protein
MKDIIKKVLREFKHPILVYEIVISTNLLEQDYIRTLGDKKIKLLKNTHSQENIGIGKFSRVDPNIIDDSIRDIENELIVLSKKIVNNCFGKLCSIVVVDKPNGIDYHIWLIKTKKDNINLIINTSIHHPEHLYNSLKSPMLIIQMDGSINTKFI